MGSIYSRQYSDMHHYYYFEPRSAWEVHKRKQLRITCSFHTKGKHLKARKWSKISSHKSGTRSGFRPTNSTAQFSTNNTLISELPLYNWPSHAADDKTRENTNVPEIVTSLDHGSCMAVYNKSTYPLHQKQTLQFKTSHIPSMQFQHNAI